MNQKKVTSVKISKKNIIFSLLPFLIFLFIFIAYLNIDNTQITLNVMVDNDKKTPLNNIKIVLDENIISENSQESEFQIKPVEYGDHIIKVEKDGYVTFKKEINLKKNENLKLVVRMTENINDSQINTNNDIPAFVALGNNYREVNIINKNKSINLINNDNQKNFIVLPEKNKLYVSNFQSNYISVIDYNKNQEIKKIFFEANTNPDKMILSLEKRRLYIQLSGTNEIIFVDTETDSIIENADKFKSGKEIKDILVNPANNKLMIITDTNISDESGELFKINKFTGSKTLIYRHFLILLSSQTNEIVKLDMYSGKEEKIKLNASSLDIAIADDLKELYVLSEKEIKIIDLETNNITKTINDESSKASSILYFKNNIYTVENKDNYIEIFNISKNKKERVNISFNIQKIVFID